jgi:hypothetical protein
MFASWKRISGAWTSDNREFTVQKKSKAAILLNTRKETGLEVDTDETNIWQIWGSHSSGYEVVFWDVRLCSPVSVDWCFREIYCIYRQDSQARSRGQADGRSSLMLWKNILLAGSLPPWPTLIWYYDGFAQSTAGQQLSKRCDWRARSNRKTLRAHNNRKSVFYC